MNIKIEQPNWGQNCGMGWVFWTVTKHNFISAAINWFEKWDNIDRVPVTHMGIISGQDETLEAFSDGVHKGTLSRYLGDEDVALITRPLDGWTPEVGARIVAEASKYLGQKYGYTLIVAMAVANSILGKGLDWITRGWFGRTIERWADSKKQMICSELVATALSAMPEYSGKGFLQLKPYQVTPMIAFNDHYVFGLDTFELVWG